MHTEEEIKEYLARIRDTIAKSEMVVSQAALRIAETDRMLESQGLTREQVMAMRFTDAQGAAANEELKRRGMDPLEKWDVAQGASYDEMHALRPETPLYGPGPSSADADAELENRQKKFGMMMKPFQI